MASTHAGRYGAMDDYVRTGVPHRRGGGIRVEKEQGGVRSGASPVPLRTAQFSTIDTSASSCHLPCEATRMRRRTMRFASRTTSVTQA